MTDIGEAFDTIKRAVLTDMDYAWAWHCNLAVPMMDAAAISHESANKAAALIMAQMFDCDITKHPAFDYAKSPAQEYYEIRSAADKE